MDDLAALFALQMQMIVTAVVLFHVLVGHAAHIHALVTQQKALVRKSIEVSVDCGEVDLQIVGREGFMHLLRRKTPVVAVFDVVEDLGF